MIRIFAVVGTRPEAIKMAPVVRACRHEAENLDLVLCSTGQHRHLLDDALAHFQLVPDVRLPLPDQEQGLAGNMAHFLEGLDRLLKRYQPHCVVAQGDTTTTLAAAMAAFYRGTAFVHIEAGLRSRCLDSPWPEEFNRRIATLAATLHCAPTQRAAQHLRAEGVPDRSIHVVGNTIVDALLWTRRQAPRHTAHHRLAAMLHDHPVVLVTAHRRENHGTAIDNLCRAVDILARRFPHVRFAYVLHSHPAARQPAQQRLADRANVHLLEPLPYPLFIWLLDRSALVITDSGGIQEEAPSLGKPVVVVRNTTERQEAVELGIARLVGTGTDAIVREVAHLLHAAHHLPRVTAQARQLFGDGRAAHRIARLLSQRAWQPAAHAVPRHPARCPQPVRPPAARPASAASAPPWSAPAEPVGGPIDTR